MSKKLAIRELLFNSPKANFEDKTRAEIFRVYWYHEDIDRVTDLLRDPNIHDRLDLVDS